jgi:hypothetical protein
MVQWFQRDPAALAEVEDALIEYPDLRIVRDQEHVGVSGTFPVMHDGKVLARFEVEIGFPATYPRKMPFVIETGGRIPRTADRHVFPHSGRACLQVPEEWKLAPDRSFRRFLKVPVHNYFLGQALVELGEPWPFGERSHGIQGLLESYGDVVGETDPGAIVRTVQILAGREPKGHWQCPCGSGQRLRRCCGPRIRELRTTIPAEVARDILDRLQETAGFEGINLPALEKARE